LLIIGSIYSFVVGSVIGSILDLKIGLILGLKTGLMLGLITGFIVIVGLNELIVELCVLLTIGTGIYKMNGNETIENILSKIACLIVPKIT